MSNTDKKSLWGGIGLVAVVVLLAVFVSDSPMVTYDAVPSGEVTTRPEIGDGVQGKNVEIMDASQPSEQIPIEETEAYKQLIERAQTQLENAKEGERPIIEAQMRLAKLFSGKSIDKEEVELLYQESINAMLDYQKLHPNDFEVQIKVVHSLFAASASGPALGIDTSKYLMQSILMARELTKKFPNEVRSYAQLGFILHQTKNPEFKDEIIKSFEKCLEMKPDSRFCSGGLESAKKITK